jgi:hypothetical protein
MRATRAVEQIAPRANAGGGFCGLFAFVRVAAGFFLVIPM